MHIYIYMYTYMHIYIIMSSCWVVDAHLENGEKYFWNNWKPENWKNKKTHTHTHKHTNMYFFVLRFVLIAQERVQQSSSKAFQKLSNRLPQRMLSSGFTFSACWNHHSWALGPIFNFCKNNCFGFCFLASELFKTWYVSIKHQAKGVI